MDFMEMYAQKKMTAEQAASLVKSGDWVDYGWCVNTPVAVDAALAKRLPELENVNFRGGILMWVPEIFQIDDPAAHMTWNSWQDEVTAKAKAAFQYMCDTARENNIDMSLDEINEEIREVRRLRKERPR